MHRDVTSACSSCSPVKTAGHAARSYFAVLISKLAFAAPVGSWSLAGESWRASPCTREPGWHDPKLPPAVVCAGRAEFPQPLQVSNSSVTPLCCTAWALSTLVAFQESPAVEPQPAAPPHSSLPCEGTQQAAGVTGMDSLH